MKDGVEDSEGCPSRCRVDRMHQVVDRADTEAQAHEEQLHLGVKKPWKTSWYLCTLACFGQETRKSIRDIRCITTLQPFPKEIWQRLRRRARVMAAAFSLHRFFYT